MQGGLRGIWDGCVGREESEGVERVHVDMEGGEGGGRAGLGMCVVLTLHNSLFKSAQKSMSLLCTSHNIFPHELQ